MTTANHSLSPAITSATLVVWINRALEVCWLLTTVLVPLAFLDRDFVVSEAIIGYVEVPKVALLRTLVAVMAVLWLIEWGLQGRLSPGSLFSDRDSGFLSTYWLRKLRGWLAERPSRWLFVAVWFFLGSTLLSTVLSGSFNVSMWGEVPGQDGYPAYTIVAYVVLFGIIATHLKSRAQVARLIGAVVVMGVLVGGYAILQHYGHDFFNLSERTGGGASGKATSFMGNTIFAAAVMMMTIPITLAVATITLPDRGADSSVIRGKTTQWLLVSAVATFWVFVLTVQLLGLSFTFSRAPWGGTLLALLVFVGLVAVFVGWRAFGRAGVLLGFAAGVTLAVVQWSIPISSPWLWFGTVLTLMGAIGLAHIVGWSWFGRAVLVLGVAATIAAAIILIPSWFGGGSGADDQQGSQATAVEERLKSVRTAVLSGFSGRSTHWSGSWRLIRDRPWFEFDSLSLSWLRPVIGYGPELFRYTYLLESPSEGRDLVPLEPDHAHNFFIHQTVEQGLLGLLSSLGLFAAVFLVGGSTLLRRGAELSLFHKLILIGLLATFAGRFLEMIFGVARVSDLTILWILLAALAAVAGTGQTSEAVPQAAVPQAAPSRSSRRQRNRPVPGVPSRTTTATWGSFGRLAIVASLIGIIGVFTWVKGINNVRAAAEVGNAIDSFQAGDYQTALAELDRATELAPDISVYHNHKASIYMAYIINKNVPSERGCSSQSDLPYDLCLANEGLQNNREAVGQRPFYYRSVLVLANSTSSLSAYSLELEEEAVRRYEEVLALVPDSWRVRDILAEAYLNTSQPDRAIPLLKESILISQDTPLSARAYFLLGKGQGELGQLRESIVSLERALELELSNASPLNETEVLEATELLADAYVSLGRPEPAAQLFFKLGEEYWNRVTIEQSPGFVDVDREAPPSGASGENSEDIAAQVLTRSEDDLVQSSAHLERGLELGLPGDLEIQAHQTLAEVYLALGEPGMAAESLFDLGGIYHNQGDLEEAVRYLERSLEVAPSSALADQAHQALAEVYTSLGRIDEAAMHRQDGRP